MRHMPASASVHHVLLLGVCAEAWTHVSVCLVMPLRN